jgi:hypothetical protein
MQKASVSVSSAEILALHTTPKTLVAAQGANTGIIVDKVYIRYNHVTTAYGAIAGGDNLNVGFNGGSTVVVAIETLGFIDQTATSRRTGSQGNSITVSNNEVLLNTALELELGGAVTTGDGTLDVVVYYYVIDDSAI